MKTITINVEGASQNQWSTFLLELNLMKKCKQCKKEFEPKDEFDMFCGDECKQEALADLDKDSDECLSCQ